MSMQNDVNVKSLSSTGSIFEGRARVRGMIVTPASSAGNVALSDGSTQKLIISTVAGGETFNVLIPDQGVLFKSNVVATLNNASVTVFYA